MNWRETASTQRWDVRPFVAGTRRRSRSKRHFENVNPATEGVLCTFSEGTAEDIDDAVLAARARVEDGAWSSTAAPERAAVLHRLIDLLLVHKVELALLDSLEMGKPIQQALYDVEHFAPLILRSCAGYADKLVGESAPTTTDQISFTAFSPRGVVGAITPWNFPLVNALFKVAPALAAGNCVVLKPSELAPSSALRLAELAIEAGLPEGVLNVVPGLGRTVGAALAAHDDVDMIAFTGSTETGRRIMALAGQSNGKPVMLECGGKSPHVVFDDARDLERTAAVIVEGLVWNQGQVCSARTRVIAHEGIKPALLDLIVERLRKVTPADPLDPDTTFGPLASPAQRHRVKSFIEQGERDGAVAALKGAIRETGGCFVAPTVFDRVTSDMSIAREEIFGPVLCIQKFASEAEAITLANATAYGLEASAWTSDLGRAKRMAYALKAGSVTIHTSGPETPGQGYVLAHEPQKASGFGCELGLRGLEAYSTLKLITMSGA